MERAYNERDKTESGSYAQEYLNYFLEDEPSPGIAYEYRLVQQLLPTVTAAEVSTFVRTLLGDDSRVLLADVAGEGGRQRAVGSRSSGDAGVGRSRSPVTPWTETTVTRELVENKPAPAAITLAPRGPRRRRHDRALCERRRGVAETDRLQERSGALRAWKRRADRRWRRVRICPRRTLATSYVGLSGVGGIEGAGPAEDARRANSPRPRRTSACRSTAFPAARRRPSSKRRCNCSIWISPRRTTTRRRLRC